jgi:hypothetical protein
MVNNHYKLLDQVIRIIQKSLGRQVGEELRSKGINDLALNWREKVEEWNNT